MKENSSFIESTLSKLFSSNPSQNLLKDLLLLLQLQFVAIGKVALIGNQRKSKLKVQFLFQVDCDKVGWL
jgi:hypothetical protein